MHVSRIERNSMQQLDGSGEVGWGKTTQGFSCRDIDLGFTLSAMKTNGGF